MNTFLTHSIHEPYSPISHRPRNGAESRLLRLFIVPDKKNYPAVRQSYIIELKYLSAKDSEETAKKQREEAVKQLQLFATDRKVAQMTRDTQLHLIVMKVRVCKLVRLEEV